MAIDSRAGSTRRASMARIVNDASVTQSSCLADATVDELLGLLLQLAHTTPQRPVHPENVQVLCVLAREDSAFQSWLNEIRVAEPTLGGSDIAGLAQNLPELIARHPPPTSIDEEGSKLGNAAHLAVRLRSGETYLARELAMRQREAIYHFAYGLSHELNNPLAIIAGRAGMLARAEASDANRSVLESIVENAQRGSEMLRDLMLVARPPTIEPQLVDAGNFFDNLLHQAQSWAKEYGVRIDSRIVGVRELNIDPSALREALWALLRNSIEAVGGCGRQDTPGDLATIHFQVDVTESNCVRIAVADQGPGLSPRAMQHCFDPFFSGREAGRGLGLGLSKAQRIVTLHGGELSLTNLQGGGCSAIVLLPSY